MSLKQLIQDLGNIRDGLLVSVGLIYILGYMVWSVLAWRHNLGPLPVLDAQYFAAGLPPLLAVLTVVLLIHFSRRFLLDKWPKWLETLSWRKQLLVYGLVTVLALSSLLIVVKFRYLANKFQSPVVFFLPLFSVIFFASLLLEPQQLYLRWLQKLADDGVLTPDRVSTLKKNWAWKFIGYPRLSNLYLILALLGAAGIFFWVQSLYSRIPQEFGGGKPRCAQLDVIWAELSPETRQHLSAGSPRSEAEKTVSTAELIVYFAGKESIIVSAKSQNATPTEVDRQAVRAVRWCPDTPSPSKRRDAGS